MKIIGQQKSLLKLAAILMATSIFGMPSALACNDYTPDPTDPNKLGCGNNSAYAYAYTVNGTSSTSTISAVQGGLYWYDGGYGITSYYRDSHTIDNSRKTDFLALKFSSAVKLDSVEFGWVSGDGDFSVLAYKGTDNPTLNGQTIGSLYASGSGAWEMVGNYSNSSIGTVSVNASNVTSSWWIISAYNSNFLGSGTSGLDGDNDYMKVLAVACKETGGGGGGGQVSEPASLLIFGGGLVGMMALRRRRQAAI